MLCVDGVGFSWKAGVSLNNIDVQVPNDVLNIGPPLSIKVNPITTPEIFLDNIKLDDFVKNNSNIEFSHDLFTSYNGDLVTGPVSL